MVAENVHATGGDSESRNASTECLQNLLPPGDCVVVIEEPSSVGHLLEQRRLQKKQPMGSKRECAADMKTGLSNAASVAVRRLGTR